MALLSEGDGEAKIRAIVSKVSSFLRTAVIPC